MMPPATSALLLYFRPKILPTFKPKTDRQKVVQPMSPTALKMSTSGSSAKVMPTARASILVATASISMALKPKDTFSSCPSLSSSRDRPSLSMFPPIRHSSTKATQWSTEVMYFSKVVPSRYPTMGISA